MSLRPKKENTMKQLKEENRERFASIHVKNTVKETLMKQFSLWQDSWASISSAVPYVNQREFKSIRRGAKTRLTNYGLDSSMLTDRLLTQILQENGIEVRQ
jgi:antitoxin component of RelBE/YafQ-DinJ toxin-antitoxin module